MLRSLCVALTLFVATGCSDRDAAKPAPGMEVPDIKPSPGRGAPKAKG